MLLRIEACDLSFTINEVVRSSSNINSILTGCTWAIQTEGA